MFLVVDIRKHFINLSYLVNGYDLLVIVPERLGGFGGVDIRTEVKRKETNLGADRVPIRL